MNDETMYRVGSSGVRTTIERCMNPDHRSYSADKDWDQCQWAAHAVDTGLVEHTWPASVAVGSAVDAAVRAKCLGEPFDLDGLVGRFFAEYGCYSDDRREATEKARALYDLWEAEVYPEWLAAGIYAVDWELHFTIDKVTYHVHIDVLLADGTVVDLKTSEQRLDRTGPGRVEVDVQLTTYAAGIVEVYDHLPPKVILDGLIFGKMPDDVAVVRGIRDKDRPKPWWDRHVGFRTAEQLATFREDVRRREASRRFARTTGIYQTQGRAHPWACKTCPAKSLCPSWAGFAGGPEIEVKAA